MTLRYLTINDHLHLVEQRYSLPPKSTLTAPLSVNHIWIIDRSGSMYGQIRDLCADICMRLTREQIAPADTISLGYFSGPHQFDWILKGASGNDLTTLQEIVKRHASTLSTTCFSEILGTVSGLIDNLKNFSPIVSFMLFTDGYPVVNDQAKERKAIFTALDAIKPRVTQALWVGYGQNYNKELMADMAEKSGGALIHSNNLANFSPVFRHFVEQAKESEPRARMRLDIPTDKQGHEIKAIFTVEGADVVLQSLDAEGYLCLQPREDLRVYYLTDRPPEKTPNSGFTMTGPIYAAALVSLQKSQDQQALDLLGWLGDVRLIDQVNQAFTVDEYGRAEQEILQCVSDARYRLSGGHKKNYLPEANAFCLLDALELLQRFEENKFYPYAPGFQYNRIGPPAKTREGYPKFTPEENAACTFRDLTWHSSQLNLSLLAKINGTVALQGDPMQMGFAPNFPTWIYRNFAIVKDKELNTPVLPASLSQPTHRILHAAGVIDEKAWQEGKIYPLLLWKLPVINRMIAQGCTSATALCRDSFREMELTAHLKVYKALIDEIAPDKRIMPSLTEAQEEYLKGQGIGKNGFSPPRDTAEPTDFYEAKEVYVKIKGASSLPSLKEVRERMTQGKKQNAGGALMLEALDAYATFNANQEPLAVKIAWLNEKIFAEKFGLHIVRSRINRARFAAVLGKAKWDEFPERKDEQQLNLDDVEYTLVYKTIKVDI